MARLSDVYKSKNNREIVLTNFQAQVFEAVIEKFKREGVGGDDIFEETYVLQKDIAEYITGNIAEGGGAVGGLATQTYNFILGIEAAAPVVPDPVVDPIVEEEVIPLQESPIIPVKKPGPRNIPFRDLRDKNRPFRPKSMAEFLKNRGAGGIKPAINITRGGARPAPKPFVRPGNPFLSGIRGGKNLFGGFGESPAGSMASALRNRGGIGSRGFMDLFRNRI